MIQRSWNHLHPSLWVERMKRMEKRIRGEMGLKVKMEIGREMEPRVGWSRV